MNEVFLVYENADRTEGRGPMRIVEDSGFFTSEKEAWDFADTISGVMGRKPSSGSWRNEEYPDVYVLKYLKHDSQESKLKKKLKQQISDLQRQLKALN